MKLTAAAKRVHWEITKFVGKRFLVDIGCIVVAARMIPEVSVAVCGCCYTRSLSELRMEKVTWHSERPVILYTTFSSVRNVGNTFMACVQVYLVLSRKRVILPSGCGVPELASARHSMGASRISSALFDLKSHSAATTLQLNHQDAGPKSEESHFSLCKWASSESPKSCSEEDMLLQKKSNSPKVLNQDGSSNSVQEEASEAPEATESPRTVEDQARKERLKSLSMFGVLVCPKLRAAQSSFETALETLVEVANKRADLLNAYEQVQEKMESATN